MKAKSNFTVLTHESADSKAVNIRSHQDNVIIESIPDYLARVKKGIRVPGMMVVIVNNPNNPVTVTTTEALFDTVLRDYTNTYYAFIGGIRDEDFKEVMLAGTPGAPGPEGPMGPRGYSIKGDKGDTGAKGDQGWSAYEVAVINGYQGTVSQWLLSLVGAAGTPGAPGQSITGPKGDDGYSAYEIALQNGYVGTEVQWLASLKGEQGEPGKDGASALDGLQTSSVVWISGLTYAIKASGYFDGVLVQSPTTLITLSTADSSYSRIDVFTLTSSGTIGVVEGTPSDNPQKPAINPSTELEISFVLLPANAVVPPGITDEIVYNENIEWTPTSGGTTADFAYTTNPFNGTKCINITNIGSNDYVQFTASGAKTIANYETLSLFLKLKLALPKGHSIYASLRLGSNVISNEIALSFDSSILTWQSISIPMRNFIISSGTTFDNIRFRWVKTNPQVDFQGIYLDYIKLQGGTNSGLVIDTVELTGDVIGKGKTGVPITTHLKTVIMAATVGSSTKTVTLQIDANGRITAASENNISVIANFSDGTNSGTVSNSETLKIVGGGVIGVAFSNVTKTFTVSMVGGASMTIPNYYVTNLTQFTAAYNDIRANYNGGNIYINGSIILTGNLTLNMVGISIYGSGAGGSFNFCNSNSSGATVYRIIITDGNPSFYNITFAGTSGQQSINMASWTNRYIFELTNVNSPRIRFEKCVFADIIGGVNGPVIAYTADQLQYNGLTLSMDGCSVVSHSNGIMNPFTYAGFTIHYSGNSTYFRMGVSLIDHVASAASTTTALPVGSSDCKFNFTRGAVQPANINVYTDETVWIGSIADLANFSRKTNYDSAVDFVGEFAADDVILVQDASDNNNIRKVPIKDAIGREVEMSTDSGNLVWRYVGTNDWNILTAIPADGAKGDKGDTGVGIDSIDLTATNGLVKTYTITFTDNSTTTFDVTDGATGADGAPGAPGADGKDGVSSGQIYYFHHVAAESPAGYEGLERIPANSTEDDEWVDINNTEALLDKYITLVNDPGVNVIKAGIWYFDMFHYVSTNAGVTKFRYEVWKRASDTTETKLFEVLSAEINATTVTEFETEYIQVNDIALVTDDRIFVKVYATTTHNGTVRCHFVYEGTTHASHIHTPIGIQGVVGDSAYVYVRYASDNAGTGFSATPSASLKYIAVLTSTVEITSPVVSDFTGLWVKYIGENGTNGTNGADGAVPKQVTGLTLSSGSWSLVNGLYEYTLSNANITSTSVVDVVPDNADISVVVAAVILPNTVSSAGSVKIYAQNAPTGNIGCTIIIMETV